MEITVNDKVIGEREIARETQYHPADTFEQARRKAAEALVVRELLLQRARRLMVEGGDESEEARIQALIARDVKTPRADVETCRRYYRTHLGRFRSPDLIEARHILFAASPDDAESVAAARAKAQNAIDLLKQRPDRFAELARELSACPSCKQGGNLGQLTRGSTVPELETFLFELEPGQLCPVPVRSRYGFHVLQLQHRVEGKTLPFEAVQAKVAEYLEERVWRQAVCQYIQLLIGASNITGIELKGTSSPLVQ
jgi:peptidyl-prolyl cis-trans isomerase C